MCYYAEYASALGTLLLTSDGEALTGLWLNRKAPEYPVPMDDLPAFSGAGRWLDAYFRGEPREIDFPLAASGTPFQKQVWQLLLQIPYGETTTYGAIAREMARLTGKEKMSAQAVGQAVGKNPISIIVPCHRVVGAQGQLTGYAGGMENKIWLLHHEKVIVG